jgi:hypothetical protein
MSKWKQIESYMDSKSMHESKFNITRKQAQMILDLKKDELKKMRFLAMLDIDKDEVKKLGKIDPSIVKAIGKQGGSFRTSMVRKRANEEVEIQEQFSTGMIDKLRKAYGPMKGKKIVPGPLMKTFDKIDKNKDALIQLYKADIPFVSQMAVSRLISKHNMKGKDINKLREDAPTNSVASGGVDMNPTGLSKKKRELDARTKEYKIHARKLMAQREKRKLKAQKSICGSFRKNVKENTDNFAREEFIVEDNVAILRKIVKDKRNMPVKLKDGQMKVDLYTASAFVQTLDKIKKPDTKKKLEFIINKGNKAQFLRTVDVIFK